MNEIDFKSKPLTKRQHERYKRHLLIDEIGEKGQQKLLQAKVLLVGVGGLGSPIALYLAAAGIGTIGLIDDDVVDISNLQRQIIHKEAFLGKPKVISARQTLLDLNHELNIQIYEERLSSENIKRIFSNYDLIIDGCDNFTTRYLMNYECVRSQKTLILGSVGQFNGQVMVVQPQSPCYRCLYPELPEKTETHVETGILGVVPGTIGTIQATEAIKIIVGIGSSLVGKVLLYNALSLNFRLWNIQHDPKCSVCG